MTDELKKTGGSVKEFTLPSGILVTLKEGKMRDVIAATKNAGDDKEKIMLALIARLATFNGKAMVMEDIENLNLRDSMKLLEVFGEEVGPLAEAGK